VNRLAVGRLTVALYAALALAVPAAASGAFGFLSSFGSAGSGDGQFSQPRGIASSSTGTVYVADTLNHRVETFDAAGSFLGKWGSLGSADGQLNSPYDVAVDGSGNVYVVDTGNARIEKFDAAGAFLSKWGSGGSADGEFSDPRALAVDSQGNVYVADVQNNRVQKFGPSGNFLTKWGSLGTLPAEFNGLSGIAVDGSDQIYTLESGARRVQRFGSGGAFIGQWTISGSTSNLTGIDVDSGGSVYVVDAGQSAVRRYAADGTLLDTVRCGGLLEGISAHPTNRIYVAGEPSALVLGDGGGDCPGGPHTPVMTPPPPPPPPPPPIPCAVCPAPPAGQVSVSIEDGARFTNDPHVMLDLVWPPANDFALISNDGGFRTAQRIALAPRVPWRLDSSGPERLPKTVYVRWANQLSTPSQTFTDDIILDEAAPTVSSALVSRAGRRSAVRAAAGGGRFVVRVRAKDNLSGLGKMQLAANKRKPGKLRAFHSLLTVTALRAPVYVRVRDRAGNMSRWRRLRSPPPRR
jgi:sugar lactone lactonase YvrE